MVATKKHSILITGRVIKGRGYGRKIGFPTINLDRRNFTKLAKKPKMGIYYGLVNLLNKKYKAGIVIGPRDNKGLPKIEAHLIGFSKNAYGRKAIFEIKGFIRKFKYFNQQEKLILQIKKDMAFVAKQQLH